MLKVMGLMFCVAVVVTLLLACAPPATTTPVPPPATASSTQSSAIQPTAESSKPSNPTSQPPRPNEVPYYQGKTITMLVASGAGGGTDMVGRIIAAVLPKYIPGNPRVIISNMGGGGGLNATIAFYAKTKPDGFTLLQSSNGAISAQAATGDTSKYDVTKFRYLGNVCRTANVILVRKGQLPRLTDPKARPMIVGSKEGTETWGAVPLWGKQLLGWNLQWVLGYSGDAEVQLAAARGEVDVMGTSNTFAIRQLVDGGIADYLCAVGVRKEGKLVRRSDFPDVPTFEELLGDKKPDGVAWQSFMNWIAPGLVDTFVAAPPKTPDNVMAILLDAYTKMSKDSQFDDMIKKSVNPVYQVNIGKDTHDLVSQVLVVPPEVATYTRELLKNADLLAR